MRNRRKINKKGIIMFVALCVLFIGGSGGTLSWLSDMTESFIGNIAVSSLSINFASDTTAFFASTREESPLYIIPGADIYINASPVVVAPDSENCFLFIELDKNVGALPHFPFEDYFSYQIADGWLSSDDGSLPENVFYRIVKNSSIEQHFEVIEDQKVTVSDSITRNMLDILSETDDSLPSLTISAFAVQYTGDGITPLSVSDAWDIISTHDSNS